ncbi:MAG: amidase [Planctomycetaceae bacterium]|nr:amidase [Planctomycetaceae bacterium]
MNQQPGPTDSDDSSYLPARRRILQVLAAAGIGTPVLHRVLADQTAATGKLSAQDIARAEWIAGVTLTDQERETTAQALAGTIGHLRQIRSLPVTYDDLPAVRFDPEMFLSPGEREHIGQQCPPWLTVTPSPPPTGGDFADNAPVPTDEDLSFASVRQLGELLRRGVVSSRQLTEHCLSRLREHDSQLRCVVTLTERLALEQADLADRELAAGRDRGPLHGIPWGAKDLIAVPGYPTTWGAPQFLEQFIDQPAAVYSRLRQAGAVLTAKLSLGALAMGDEWFGGQTKNPWNPLQGSSGSSAGSAAAVAAGLLPFAIGSETLGSIVSPSRRCGVTSLRPTFGRISRAGCMPLSWTMDKLGPMARRVDDCGLVLSAVHGADSGDPTSVERWFRWPVVADLAQLKIGRVENRPISETEQVLLTLLEEIGAQIVSVELPDDLHEWSLAIMLDVEAAAVFREFTNSDDTVGLNRWPGIFCRSRFVSAVDFLHASRIRGQLMRRMQSVFERCQLYVGGSDLGITNLTGHPTVVLPVALTSGSHPQPTCATLTGRLFDEATLLAVAALVEQQTGLTGVRPTR